MSEKPKALIIGAGVAGLTAALRLAEAGQWQPVLFESEARPGGLARCLHFKGVSTDMGPHRIHTEIPEVAELIEDVAAPSLFTVQRKSHIYLRGHYLPYPPSPLAMAHRLGPHRLLGFGLSFLAEQLRSRPATETYESLMRQSFGKALYHFLLGPYSEKTWKCPPSQIHADTARVRVSAGSLAKMVRGLFTRESKGSETSLKEFKYVRGGVETLVHHLRERAEAAGAELRLGERVTGLDLDGTRVSGIRVCDGSGQERIETGEMVLSTAPLPKLIGELLPSNDTLTAAREAATGLGYLNIALVCLIVRRKVITGDNWLYFPEPGQVFNRAYEAKSMDPSMAPEDRSVICAEITAHPGDALWQRHDEELADQTARELAATGLFEIDEIDEKMVHRLEYAYPIYTLDYVERLETIFNALAGLENLITLGRQGLFNHNNMDHSMFMGLRAAQYLNQNPPREAAQRWYDQADEFKRLRIVD